MVLWVNVIVGNFELRTFKERVEDIEVCDFIVEMEDDFTLLLVVPRNDDAQYFKVDKLTLVLVDEIVFGKRAALYNPTLVHIVNPAI